LVAQQCGGCGRNEWNAAGIRAAAGVGRCDGWVEGEATLSLRTKTKRSEMCCIMAASVRLWWWWERIQEGSWRYMTAALGRAPSLANEAQPEER
jgi:hypothetical protein